MSEIEKNILQEFGLEQEDDPEVRKIFEVLYDDISELNAHIKRFIQGGKLIDVTQTENNGS